MDGRIGMEVYSKKSSMQLLDTSQVGFKRALATEPRWHPNWKNLFEMLHQLTIVFVALVIHSGFAQNYEGESCLDPNTQTVGRCIDVKNCEAAKQDFLTTSRRPTPCGLNSSRLVCCRDTTALLDSPTPSAATPVANHRITRAANDNYFNSNRRAGITSLKKCQGYINQVTEKIAFVSLGLHSKRKTIPKPKCIYRGTELIVGGEKAALAEFPHMAAVGWKTQSGSYDFKCGGSLISENFVLSAAHCTYSEATMNKTPEIVRLGDLNLDPNVNDGADPVQVTIRNIHRHPDYHSPAHYDDIALFELENNVNFNNNIRPACLWTDSDFGGNQKALATGWGVTETGYKSNDLRKVSLSILDNLFCNNSLSDIMNRHWVSGFAETQMCAGETREGKDTCQGDSGSPLQVVSEQNQCIFKVIGITSFGPKSCGNNPAVYTRVSSYVGWIESVVWPNES